MNIVHAIRRRSRVTMAALLAAAAALIVIPLSQMTSASAAGRPAAAAATATSAGPKPSIVLVHGAWGDSANWNGVAGILQRDGYTVYAPPNPLDGLGYDSAYIRDFLHTISGPIILVGHSYGGAVITDAATGDTQVKALVYVDGFAPDQGETIGQLVSAVPGSCAVPANLALATYPGAPAGAADAYIAQSVFPSCMANGLPLAQARELAATQRPLTTLALTQKSGVPAWKTIPSWAVIGTADHAIPPAELLFMAHRMHARITMISGAPHLSMIYSPRAVAKVILEAANGTT